MVKSSLQGLACRTRGQPLRTFTTLHLWVVFCSHLHEMSSFGLDEYLSRIARAHAQNQCATMSFCCSSRAARQVSKVNGVRREPTLSNLWTIFAFGFSSKCRSCCLSLLLLGYQNAVAVVYTIACGFSSKCSSCCKYHYFFGTSLAHVNHSASPHNPLLCCLVLGLMQLTFRTFNRDFDIPNHNDDNLAPLLRDSLMPGECGSMYSAALPCL